MVSLTEYTELWLCTALLLSLIVAVIALEKTKHTVESKGDGEEGTIEVVNVCVETNSTLERTFVLPVIIRRSSANTTNSEYIYCMLLGSCYVYCSKINSLHNKRYLVYKMYKGEYIKSSKENRNRTEYYM